jgi:hypothetical protein
MSRPSLPHIARIAALGLATTFVTLSPVLAADFSKEQLAAARAAIEASHVADGFDNVLLGVAQQAKNNFVRSNPSYSTQIEAATNKVAVQLASERVELDRQIQQIWASKFTIPELQEITKFYTSPVGQKLSKETSAMVGQSMQAVQIYQQKLSEDMATKVREELKKQGLPF